MADGPGMDGGTGSSAARGRDRSSVVTWIVAAAIVFVLLIVAVWAISDDDGDNGISEGDGGTGTSQPAGEIVDGDE